MARELGLFPYSRDGVIAPNTDGTIASVGFPVPETNIAEPTEPDYMPPKNSGAFLVDGGIGETGYVFCNKIAYGVFAGDS